MPKTNIKGITLIGATGFLGSSIAKELERLEIPWTGVSTESSKNKKIVTVNPQDKEALISIINDNPIVINAAGSLKPKDFEKNTTESLEIFWKTVENFSEVFNSSQIEKLIHLSSAGTVYGDSDSIEHHTENSVLKPISWYGRAKVFEELNYEHCARNMGYEYLCVRITNPYGNEEKSTHGFIDVLINSICEGRKFDYYADCDPCRDFIYASDMSKMILNLIVQNKTGIFNIGSGEVLHLSEIINYIKKIVDNPTIERTLLKPSYDVIHSSVSIEKIIKNNSYVNNMKVFEYIDNKFV